MNDKQQDSYARRRKRYHDNSYLGDASDQNEENQQSEQAVDTEESVRQVEPPDPTPPREQPPILKGWPTIEGKAEEPVSDIRQTRQDSRNTDSAQYATEAKRAKKKDRRREIVSWFLSIGLAIVAALLIRAFVFEIILVDGDSMYPTLHTDERVAIEKVTRYNHMPKRGDIIIVEYPNRPGTYVKRAVGLPGETIEIHNSTVYINGNALEEDYIHSEPYNDMDAQVVPEDHVFVIGDNRARSLDSRSSDIGPIPHNSIVGHGLFVIWPLDSIHTIK